MCGVSAEELGPVGDAFAEGHRSRLLTAESVRDADLILTMEREQRSVAVQAAPGSQMKVFTLREAEALLEVLVARGGPALASLPELARAMHGVRGLAPLVQPAAAKKHWWSRPTVPEDPMTIQDGHGLSLEEHTAAARRVRSAADRVAALMASLGG